MGRIGDDGRKGRERCKGVRLLLVLLVLLLLHLMLLLLMWHRLLMVIGRRNHVSVGRIGWEGRKE